MRKFFYFIALLFAISANWNISLAASSKVIRGVNDDGGIYTYDPDAGMVTTASQFSANSIEQGDGGGLAALIDGTTQWFHSGYNTSSGSTLPDADHYLQVDISNSPTQQIIFVFTGRAGSNHDTWDDVDIYCTNDSSVHDSWKLVKSMTNMVDGDESGTHYVSPMIDLGAAYKYVRFVVRKTTSLRQEDTYKRYFWNLDEFQMYKAIKVEDPQTLLKTVVDSISLLGFKFQAGTDPGYYPQDKCDTYTAAYNTAEAAINESHTGDEFLSYVSALRNSLKDLQKNRVKITDGYYNIINAYPEFETVQGVKKALSVNTNHQLAWGTYNQKDSKQLFKITAISDMTYSIQNMATGEYANVRPGTSINPGTKVTQVTGQTFRVEKNAPQWHISNIVDLLDYRITGWANGSGISGVLICSNADSDTPSTWYLSKETDQHLIDSLIAVGPQNFAEAIVANAITKAQNARAKNDEYDALITNATDGDAGCQIMSNAKEPNEGSYANLIDGNTGTFFHSIWSAAGPSTAHNLQIDMVIPVQKVFFKFTGRSGDYHDTPNDINIYVTNDDVLGKDPNSADAEWIAVSHLTKGFPADASEAKYTSPNFELTQACRYLRLVVNNTTTAASGRVNSTTQLPYFNFSEFQVYNGAPSAKSEYNMVVGMKDACDKVDALIKDAEAKIANHTATVSDTTAIMDAVNAMNALWVDRDALDAEMASLLDSAKTTVKNVHRSTIDLIHSVDQLSANSIEVGDGGGLAALIDGDTSTYCHSAYDTSDGSTLPDADHYLQIDLSKTPVDSLYIDFTGRVGGTDSPDSVDIYVTNDASNESSWVLVKSLQDMINGNPSTAYYTSPMIHFGATYSYVRMVVRQTATGRTEGTYGRHFWNMSEFQLYTGLPSSRIQYDYVEGMKPVADALDAAIKTSSKIGKHEILTKDPINTLRTALKAVLALYADSTECSSLFAKYSEYADSSVVGTGIGFVDAQGAIDAFRSAVQEAKATVSPTQPTVSVLNAATEKMNTAFTTFMTHVGQIVPNQWYNIVSGSTSDYAVNQPIFLGSTSTGYKLMLGGYPIDEINISSDPYAVWRFVPIEGKEGQYAIQSLGTGQYFGPYRGDGSDNASVMSHAKTPYRLMYLGNGKFKMIQVGVKNELDALKGDGTNKIVLNWPYNGGNQQAWKFEAVKEGDEMSFNVMSDNSIRVMTLPFELKGDLSLMKINNGIVNTYAVKYVKVDDNGTHLGLKLQNDFEAGEPFIMTVNDYTQYDPNGKSEPISFSAPSTVVDTSAIVVNGLVGTLEGLTITKAGLGIFVDSTLVITPATSTSISGRGGYIDPNRVINEEGTADLIIDIKGSMTGIKEVVVKKSTDRVNVYTIDGKLLKKNVKATDAEKNLGKGIYIIGKKKVAIR